MNFEFCLRKSYKVLAETQHRLICIAHYEKLKAGLLSLPLKECSQVNIVGPLLQIIHEGLTAATQVHPNTVIHKALTHFTSGKFNQAIHLSLSRLTHVNG